MAKYRRVVRFLDDYKGYIATGLLSALAGILIASSWKHTPVEEQRDLFPYPKTMQVYRMQDYNDGKPFARAIMDDGRAELLSGDNPEGTSFTSVRVLEETDVKKAQYGWRSRRGDMETRIKNSERERILQEATKSNNR